MVLMYSNSYIARRISGPAVLLLAMSGCGGGGGGEASAAAPAAARDTALALTTVNATGAATLAFGYASTALVLAQAAVDWTAALDAAAGQSVTLDCPGGGTQHLALADADGDHRAGPGDRIDVTVTACTLKGLEARFDGSLTIALTSPAAGQTRAGSVNFGPSFATADSGLTANISGALQFTQSTDRLAKTVSVRSAANAPFAITASNGQRSLTETVTELVAARTVRRDTARTSTTLQEHVASDALGGSLVVSTAAAFESWYDCVPDRGQLDIAGAGAPRVHIVPPAPYLLEFTVLLDQQAVGGASSSDLGAAYLWSSAGWVPQDESLPAYVTRFASTEAATLLVAPATTAVRPLSGSFEWQYSKPWPGDGLGSPVLRPTAGNGRGDPTAVAAQVSIEGALVTVTPSAQLQPGTSYELGFDGVTPPPNPPSGYALDLPRLSFTVVDAITAQAQIVGPAVLFQPGGLVLDASASSASGAAVASTSWRQVSGPALAFDAARSPRVVATLAAPSDASGLAVVEVEVRDAAGESDTRRISFPVIGPTSRAFFFATRTAASAPWTIVTSLGGLSSAVKIVTGYGGVPVLDAFGPDRFLASPPSGLGWSTGLAFNYGGNDPAAGNAVWQPLDGSGHCASSPSGHLTVLDIAVEADGTVSRLALDFDQRCADTGLATFGSIRLNSSVALAP